MIDNDFKIICPHRYVLLRKIRDTFSIKFLLHRYTAYGLLD